MAAARAAGLQCRHVAALFGVGAETVKKVYERHLAYPDRLPGIHFAALDAERAARTKKAAEAA